MADLHPVAVSYILNLKNCGLFFGLLYISKIQPTLDIFIFLIVKLSDDLNLASNSTSILSMVRTVPSLSGKYHDCLKKETNYFKQHICFYSTLKC